jgi:hypothetical protein
MAPRGYWNDKQNQIMFAESLANKYGWTEKKDWYNVKQKHFENNNGNGLLAGKYNGSPYAFLCEVFPNELWLPWKFKQTSKNFWNDPKNIRFYLDWLANELNFKSLDEYYYVSQNTYRKYDGMGLQKKFNGCRLEMLKFAYPCKNWQEWKFEPRIVGFFDDINNLRNAIKYIEQEEGILKLEDWYMHTCATIDKHLGKGLLSNKYDCSLILLLKYVYPNFSWKGYRFMKAPMKYWEQPGTQEEWLLDFMKHMNYSSYDELYYVSKEDVSNFYGEGIIDKYGGSYIRTFKAIVPQFPWDDNKFKKNQISKVETQWLDYCQVSSGVIERQIRVDGTKSSIDGAIVSEKIGYLFHGDYYHGHPRYPRSFINPTNKKTMGDLYSNTIKNENFFRMLGWKLYIVWEYDWIKGRKAVKKIQKLWKRRNFKCAV